MPTKGTLLMPATTTQVQLAWPWTDPDGIARKADDVVEVDVDTARDLIRAGRARVPDKTPAVAEVDQPPVDPLATQGAAGAAKTKAKGA